MNRQREIARTHLILVDNDHVHLGVLDVALFKGREGDDADFLGHCDVLLFVLMGCEGGSGLCK